jgi:thiol:disulfide interchange protein DsbA
MFARRILVLLVLTLTSLGAHAELVLNRDYRLLSKPQPVATPGKIEVIEFFSWGCPACNALEPHVKAWSARLPADVEFRYVPASIGRPEWLNLATACHAFDAIGALPKVHEALFRAIHEERRALYDEKSLTAWAAEQGIDATRFAAAYSSFGVKNKVKVTENMSRAYGVEALPTLVVDGRYVPLGNSYNELMANLDALVAKARAERAAQPR